MFESSPATWKNARDKCQEFNAHLVCVNDETENQWIVESESTAGFGDTWIGFSDKSVEGAWKWIDGCSSSYTSWHQNEPNDSGGANSGGDCAELV